MQEDSFTFNGRTYQYFHHEYNATWTNERAVEVPIIWRVVKEYSKKGKKILELGNVLSHYFTINHDILDKYEGGEKVINQDVVDFRPINKYDLIVSISTLEHVGWDNPPKEPMKTACAIDNLKTCFSPRGKIIVTVPLGYNRDMDKLLKENKLGFTKKCYLKRITKDNKWEEAEWDDVCDIKYGYPFSHANAIVIGLYS